MQLTTVPAATTASFGLQTRFGDAVPHQSWRRASEEALAALRRGESVVVLGLAGTGKTFLLQSLGQILRNEGLKTTSLEASQMLDLDSRADVLLVDEADRLRSEALDELCGRGELFILAGLPEIEQRLGRRARPAVTVTLEPLSPEDVARFIAVRLSAIGRRRDLLEPDAVLALARHSAGLLRLVVVLAGSAMFLAEHEGAERVSKRHVDEAAAIRKIESDDKATEPDLTQPSWQPPSSTTVPMSVCPEAGARSVSSLRANRVALGLGGVMLLGILGWMLLPSHRPASTPALPQRDAVLTLPPATQPPTIPLLPDPAIPQTPLGVPSPEAAPPSGSSARIVPPTPSRQVEAVRAFQGPILNETMNQKGQLSLGIRRRGLTHLTVSFHASAGLIGSGELAGTITADGRMVASGRLMMGRNPFNATLIATIVGDRLEGTATFVRPGTGTTARSRFALTRF